MSGVIDLGSFPVGVDERCRTIAEALAGARFSSEARPDIMRFKYAKLIANLANAVEVICGPGAEAEELVLHAKEEGRSVLRAAGIEFVAEEVDDIRSRWRRLGVRDIAGRERAGSSTWQSIARGTGSVETDYLNGEIALLGRLHGVDAPINELLQELAREMVRDGHAPGWLPAREVLRRAQSRWAA
jgi:2-dehydropantoate 2-reductase